MIAQNNRGFLQISFPWLFALIVGIFILALAIYGVVKLMGGEQGIQDLKTSKEIGILLNPLETGFEEAVSSSLIFPVETRISNICLDNQRIQVSQKSLNKWTQTSTDVSFENKYIFSKDQVEGRTMYVFSKPFDFPFKVADLVYMTSLNDKYCFSDAPDDIQRELENMNQGNFIFGDCTEEEEMVPNVISVCFANTGCDVDVKYGSKEVIKNGQKMIFEGDALMYGAIFSEKLLYDCQVLRLMDRTADLAELYKGKSQIIALSGCSSNLDSNLDMLITGARSLKSSTQLPILGQVASELERGNSDNSLCKLW